jgi:dTDP-4-dehydrorhamnose 3,5-epimerase-like enzyme
MLPLGHIIHFPKKGDHRGSLSVVEAERDVPFPIRRVYYIYGTKPGVDRGLHAHKALRQVAVAVNGSCDMELDDGRNKVTVCLNTPEKGVYIGPGVWHVMRNFSTDCVLVVFASEHYEEADYVRDYASFIKNER